jgi:hypothetical protein
MSPDAGVNLLATFLFVALSAANGWSSLQRQKRDKALYIARGRALEVVERLESSGCGLEHATLKELDTIKKGLET